MERQNRQIFANIIRDDFVKPDDTNYVQPATKF